MKTFLFLAILSGLLWTCANNKSANQISPLQASPSQSVLSDSIVIKINKNDLTYNGQRNITVRANEPIPEALAKDLTAYHAQVWDEIKKQLREEQGLEPIDEIERSVYFSKAEIDDLFARNAGADGIRIYYSQIPANIPQSWGMNDEYKGRSSLILRAVEGNVDMYSNQYSAEDYGKICPPACDPDNPGSILNPAGWDGSYMNKTEYELIPD